MLQVLRMGMDQHDKEMEEEEECTDVVQPCLHYMPLKVQMAISLPWLHSARESLDQKKENRHASCRFLEIIPAMMQGKKCTGICTLANVRKMSIQEKFLPILQLATIFPCTILSVCKSSNSMFAETKVPSHCIAIDSTDDTKDGAIC
jgi:hypothetical protein